MRALRSTRFIGERYHRGTVRPEVSTIRRWVLALGLQAIGGLAVWMIVAAVAVAVDTATLDIVTVLLLFGQLVIVPLGLLLLPGGVGLARSLVRGGRFLFRPGAVAALASLAFAPGQLSAAVAALYLLPATLVGAASVLRVASGLRDGSIWRPVELGRSAAGGFLFIGALFFVLHRQGFTFGAFHDLVMQLTAVHFHFVGFGLMLMAAELARRRPGFGIAVPLLLAAMLVTPIGFMTHPAVQALGAVAVVVALLIISAGTFTTLGDVGPGSRRLVFVSAVFGLLVGGMATMYTIGEALGSPLISIAVMAPIHGGFGAIGVVFFGLLGWRLATDR
jgi:hypothetical protein